jgi:hypothetical protein
VGLHRFKISLCYGLTKLLETGINFDLKKYSSILPDTSADAEPGLHAKYHLLGKSENNNNLKIFAEFTWQASCLSMRRQKILNSRCKERCAYPDSNIICRMDFIIIHNHENKLFAVNNNKPCLGVSVLHFCNAANFLDSASALFC